MISENLPRRTGLAPPPGLGAPKAGKGFEWKGIRASIVISEDLPRRLGLSANTGTGSGSEWTPGGGEAGEIRMFNHWATGLRSGLLPQDCVVATQKWPKKGAMLGEVFARVLIFGPRG